MLREESHSTSPYAGASLAVRTRAFAPTALALLFVLAAGLTTTYAQTAQTETLSGIVRDPQGGFLPGVTVELRGADGIGRVQVTNSEGEYLFERLTSGTYQITLSLVNFSTLRRNVVVSPESARSDAVLQLSFSADVLVTGMDTFANLADVPNPAENLVGIAQSASQGAITAHQLDARPIMRVGEVLETVPGLVISQHSGEGKANQYYLRGFNLDHGTDFATTVAGMPVNMPTHGHGHGYSDLNFMIPEIVTGVQFAKGPYFAEHGDFATAGAAYINYANSLPQTIARITGGGQGFGRAFAAASAGAGSGQVLGAFEVQRNDGPWERPDDFRKVNGVLRYTRGDALNGFSLTGMGYTAKWNATDQVPERAISSGLIGRFGNLDPTDGGDSYRYSGSFEWQRSRGSAVTSLAAYGLGYDLNLFSNFTFFLDDPENGDQFHQADHRFVTGAKVTHRRLGRWKSFRSQNTFGLQFRNDNISNVGLYHTVARERLDTIREDEVLQTGIAGFVQNETAWNPWLRTLAGVRIDGYRFDVDSNDPVNSGVSRSSIASPKGGVIVGPWSGTELYANAGLGFHSNDARGATITRDPSTGDAASSVTPLARARGFETGVRTVAVPHLQATATFWTLALDSELIFIGDAGSTEAGRPSHRYGLELTTYYRPRPWLTFDADVALSNAHFTDDDPAGDHVPGAVGRVVSAGATIDSLRQVFGSVRLRYFGPRNLTEDGALRSEATSLVNAELGYRLTSRIRVSVDVFNLFDARDSDIDYYYDSRLAGEPSGGVGDFHLHPALPRTARVNLNVAF